MKGKRHRWALNTEQGSDQCKDCGLYRSEWDVRAVFLTKNFSVRKIPVYVYSMLLPHEDMGGWMFNAPACPPAEPVKKEAAV